MYQGDGSDSKLWPVWEAVRVHVEHLEEVAEVRNYCAVEKAAVYRALSPNWELRRRKAIDKCGYGGERWVDGGGLSVWMTVYPP